MFVAWALLLFLFMAAVAFGAYQMAQARHWRASTREAEEDAEQRRLELERSRIAQVEKEGEAKRSREMAEVQLRLLTQTQRQLEDRFQALAAESLSQNSQLFLDRSREQIQYLIEPVHSSLRHFEEQVQAIERSRVGAYADLTAQVQTLTQLQERVRQSAEQLKTALRSPAQRGRWGEMQLRRTVELAGMVEHCDFAEQKTLFGETTQRPDLIVRLPNGCQVVVDAKVSLEAYLRAIESQDEAERLRLLADHARQVRTHLKSLGEKAYWERLPTSPEFVVAFLPLESLFSTALEHDPALLNFGAERRVLIATPLTLISLLMTVAHGWRQRMLVEDIDRIRDTGVELYGRILKMNEHFSKLGDAICRTVETYNQTVGSLERNVITSARKFKDLRPAAEGELAENKPVEASPRGLDQAKWPALNPIEES